MQQTPKYVRGKSW